MRINYNEAIHNFSSLENGDVFIYNGNCLIYMKIEEVSKKIQADMNYNAVNLANGQVAMFKNDTKIKKIDVELTIK